MTVETTLRLRDPGHSVSYETPLGSVTREREINVRLIAPEIEGTHPLVVYSHGHRGTLDDAALAHPRQMAEAGYAVAVPTHLDSVDLEPQVRRSFPFEPETTAHRVADLQALIDRSDALAEALPGHDIDASAPVAAGFSHGARTAMLLAGAEPTDEPLATLDPGNPYGLDTVADPRLAGVIAFSPPRPGGGTTPGFVDGSWEGLPVPSLWITGTDDETALVEDYRSRLEGFDGAPDGGRTATVIDGATHPGVGRPTDAAVVEAVAVTTRDFLDATVRGNTEAAQRLEDTGARLAGAQPFAKVYAGTEGSVEIVGRQAEGRTETRDTLPLDVPRASAAIEPAPGGFTLDLPGQEGVELFSIERILFEDAALERDTSGEAVAAELFYQTAYGRAGDPQGLAFWTEALKQGTDVGTVADVFAASPEFDARFGENATDEAYVEALYENALGREADGPGIDYWTRELGSGARDRGEVLADFALSEENRDNLENVIDDGVWLAA